MLNGNTECNRDTRCTCCRECRIGICIDVSNKVSDKGCAGGYKEPARYNYKVD